MKSNYRIFKLFIKRVVTSEGKLLFLLFWFGFYTHVCLYICWAMCISGAGTKWFWGCSFFIQGHTFSRGTKLGLGIADGTASTGWSVGGFNCRDCPTGRVERVI